MGRFATWRPGRSIEPEEDALSQTSGWHAHCWSLGCWLEDAWRRGSLAGRVLAVFSRSAYVETPAGDLYCLGRPELGEGPLQLLVAPLPDGWNWELVFRPGEQVQAVRAGLRLEGAADRLTVEFDAFRVWSPRWVRPPSPAAWPELVRRLPGIRAAVTAGGPAPVLAGAGGLHPVIPRLIDRYATADLPGAVEAATGLIGLGPGLTPAGDDFLAGFMAVLHWLGSDPAFSRGVMARAAGATGRISLGHLKPAAAGLLSARAHRFLQASVVPGRPPLEEALSDLARVGHTSGLDTALGIWAGLAAAAAARGYGSGDSDAVAP